MVQINIDLTKRGVFTILGVVLIVAGIFGVIAYGTSNPQGLGHSAGEIGGFPDCTAGQALSQNGGVWSCVDVSAQTQGAGDYIVDDFVNAVYIEDVTPIPDADSSGSLISELNWFGAYIKVALPVGSDGAAELGIPPGTSERYMVLAGGDGKWTASSSNYVSNLIDPNNNFDIIVKFMGDSASIMKFGLRDNADTYNSGNPDAIEIKATEGSNFFARVEGVTEQTVDLGTTFVRDTWYVMRIKKYGNSIDYYIDGVKRGTVTIDSNEFAGARFGLFFLSGQKGFDVNNAGMYIDYVKLDLEELKISVP